MCGRYYRKSEKQKIAEAFHVGKVDDFPLPPSDYNVAPTTMQPIIRANRDTGERELVKLRWGLIPFVSVDSGCCGSGSYTWPRRLADSAPTVARGWPAGVSVGG